MLTSNIARRLETDSDFQELKNHIDEKISELNTLDGINFEDEKSAAIEGRARELARKTLIAILDPFFEPEESTEDKKQHVAEKTGVL
jgi:hypothetical protein